MTLAAALVLLLAIAQLALAQEDAGTSQPAGEAQSAAPDTTQGASQTQPAGEAQYASSALDDLTHLNENNNVVVNCEAAFRRLAQLEQLQDTQASDPQFQATLFEARNLAQLCTDNGFTPSSAVPSSGESGSTDPNSEGTNQTQ